jgi:hypothetical protein
VRRKTSTMVFVRKEKNTEKQAKISDWKWSSTCLIKRPALCVRKSCPVQWPAEKKRHDTSHLSLIISVVLDWSHLTGHPNYQRMDVMHETSVCLEWPTNQERDRERGGEREVWSMHERGRERNINGR